MGGQVKANRPRSRRGGGVSPAAGGGGMACLPSRPSSTEQTIKPEKPHGSKEAREDERNGAEKQTPAGPPPRPLSGRVIVLPSSPSSSASPRNQERRTGLTSGPQQKHVAWQGHGPVSFPGVESGKNPQTVDWAPVLVGELVTTISPRGRCFAGRCSRRSRAGHGMAGQQGRLDRAGQGIKANNERPGNVEPCPRRQHRQPPPATC